MANGYTMGGFEKLMDAANIQTRLGRSVPEDYATLKGLMEFVRDEANLARVFGEESMKLGDVNPKGMLSWAVLPRFLRDQCRPTSLADIGMEEEAPVIIVSRPFVKESGNGPTSSPFLTALGASGFRAKVTDEMTTSHQIHPFMDGQVASVRIPRYSSESALLRGNDQFCKWHLPTLEDRMSPNPNNWPDIRTLDNHVPVSLIKFGDNSVSGCEPDWVTFLQESCLASSSTFLPFPRSVELPPSGNQYSFKEFGASPDNVWFRALLDRASVRVIPISRRYGYTQCIDGTRA